MEQFDIAIIGGGPAGYPAAIRAAQLGLSVAVIEKDEVLGGTCVRIGCIPSKALLESSERYHEALHELKSHGIIAEKVQLDLAAMQRRKDGVVKANTAGIDYLFKKHKIDRLRGTASFTGPGQIQVEGEGGTVTQVAARAIIIATGSVVAGLKGVELDGDRIGTSTQALTYDKVPEHLVVIGAGAIGLELGSVWKRLGARVTVLEYLPRILPGIDAEVATAALKIFKKQGLVFHLGAKVLAARSQGDSAIVEIDGAEPISCDRVLLAVGRSPNTEGLGLSVAGVECDERGRILVTADFATNVAGIYAVGDVIAGPMLAHKATEEGIACVEKIATGYGHVDYNAIPSIVYTDPEIAVVGRSEEQLQLDGIAFSRGTFPFSANGRARCIGHTEGFVKVLTQTDTDRVVGVHIIGPHAGDLIAEAVAAMTFGASSEDIARTCHAHPTLSEALHEAALAVDGRALHV